MIRWEDEEIMKENAETVGKKIIVDKIKSKELRMKQIKRKESKTVVKSVMVRWEDGKL